MRFGFAVALAVGVGLWFMLGVSTPTSTTVAGWSWPSQALAAEGDHWLALERTTLTRGEDRLVVEAGTRVTLTLGALPQVVAGSGELALASARVRLTELGLEVLSGSLQMRGSLWGPGDRLSYSEKSRGDTDVTPAAAPVETPGQVPEPDLSDAVLALEGRVLDARDHAPLDQAVLRATFSHFDDGFPAIPLAGARQQLVTDVEGQFRIPVPRADDPRLRLIIEVEVPGYLPEVHRVAAPRDASGTWQFTTIELREAPTYAWQFQDSQGLPLPGLAISFPSRISVESFIGEDAWEEGQDQRAGRRVVRYTDNEGILRLPFDHGRAQLLHATAHVTATASVFAAAEVETSQGYLLEPQPYEIRPVRVKGGPSIWLRPYQLQDAGGVPLAHALIEVTVEGQPSVRLYTDEDGSFLFAPRPEPESLIDFSNPKRVDIVVLSPELLKYRTTALMPSSESRIVVRGRVGSQLKMTLVTRSRSVEEGSVEEGSADSSTLERAAADQVEIDHDLTLVQRTSEGEVLYEGDLPSANTPITVRARGFLPARVQMPAITPHIQGIDLGEVMLERGESLQVRVQGGTAEEYARTQLRWSLRQKIQSWISPTPSARRELSPSVAW